MKKNLEYKTISKYVAGYDKKNHQGVLHVMSVYKINS